MTFPDKVLDWPHPLRVPYSNEHVIPFATVTWDRLERGLWHHRHDLLLAFQPEPPREGWLFMHSGDLGDLLMSDPGRQRYSSLALGWPMQPFGYELMETTNPDYARRGRPRLHLNDGTDVLL